MKKIVLASMLIGATTAQAQLRTNTASTADGLRDARKEMETRTDNSVLEKLEAARLEDERVRRTQFESLNFSVLSTTDENSNSNTSY